MFIDILRYGVLWKIYCSLILQTVSDSKWSCQPQQAAINLSLNLWSHFISCEDVELFITLGIGIQCIWMLIPCLIIVGLSSLLPNFLESCFWRVRITNFEVRCILNITYALNEFIFQLSFFFISRNICDCRCYFECMVYFAIMVL